MEHHNSALKTTQNLVPSVYVACLASYNNGMLHGKWISLDGSEEISTSIQEMLKTSPIQNAEEWAIHDHEYCGDLSEYAGIDTLENIQDAFSKVSSEGHDWELFCGFCAYVGEELELSALENFTENYAGSASSLQAWCDEFLESTGELDSIPSHLRFYFDISAYARDLVGNDVFTLRYGYETHVFWRF